MDTIELKHQWNTYNINLKNIISTKKLKVDTNIIKKTKININKLFVEELIACIIATIITIITLINYKLFIDDKRYLISFILFLCILIPYTIHEIYLLNLLNKHNNLETNIISKIKSINLYKKHNKIQTILSLLIGIPVVLICLPPILFKFFNQGDFYSKLDILFPKLIIGVIISLIIGTIFYIRNIKTLKKINKNLNKIKNIKNYI